MTTLIIVGILLVLLAYMWVVEPHLIRSRTWEAQGWGMGKRVLFLSDLHFGIARPWSAYAKILQKIVVIQDQKHVDAILFGGDFLDRSQEFAPQLGKFLSALQDLKIPMIACLGDHDQMPPGHIDKVWLTALLQEHGVEVLEDEVTHLGDLQIVGLHDCAGFPEYEQVALGRMTNIHAKRDARKAMAAHTPVICNQDQPTLVLSHNPDGIYRAGLPERCVVLSGHTHGGQFWPLRYLGTWSWFTIPRGSFGSWAGRTIINGRQLLVSRGLGCSLLPLRWWVLPEIWVVEL